MNTLSHSHGSQGPHPFVSSTKKKASEAETETKEQPMSPSAEHDLNSQLSKHQFSGRVLRIGVSL